MDLSEADMICSVSVEEAVALLAKLKIVFSEPTGSLPECGVCMMEMKESDGAVLAKCGHVFCKLCVPQFSNHKCPYCRASFDVSDVVDMDQATIASMNMQPDDVPSKDNDKSG